MDENFTMLATDWGNFSEVDVPTPSDANSTARNRPVMYFPWANPDNIMTKEMSDDITSALQCYVFPILTVIGLTGNILSLIVLLQKKLRSSTTSIVLTGLALSDMAFLMTNAVRKSTCIIKRFDVMAADTLNATTFYYMFYLKTAFSRVSTLLVVLISIERLIAVAFPLKVRTVVTKGRIMAAVVFCYVIVLGFCAVLSPQYTYTYIRGKPYISQTEFAKNNVEALKAYNEFFLPIVFRHIPAILVLVINTAIIVLLRRSKRFQKTVSKQDPKRTEEQKKITRMLLSVALIFLVCLIPGDVLLITATYVKGFQFFGTYHNLFMALSDMCLMFEMANACVNFVIYMVLNKNFYDTYMRLFCCCLQYMRSRDESGTTRSRKTEESALSSKKASVHDKISPVVEDEPSVGQVNEAYLE